VIAWHLLTRNQPYTDLGADYFLERQNNQAYKNRLVRQLERMATRSPWSRPRSPDPLPHHGHQPLNGDFQPSIQVVPVWIESMEHGIQTLVTWPIPQIPDSPSPAQGRSVGL
jgi:hypothetical protein